ncbi:hypothetical protein [Sediminibacillus albus]|uniref:DUF3221 domain-containing protein n=1 Tax=Sediminibacillus albus TaxID=407036 RepID=A0A1G8WGQ4_9BACI|nr:hypothetical protein [Sediminibacillus albus]SDJ76710.1 hypothetical protein SAMN05216243_0748 [Sediminibacillus albus]
MKNKWVFLMIPLLILFSQGCQQNDYTEKITVEGEVTLIEKEENYIYIDGNPIMVENPASFEVGQRVKAELIDTNAANEWDPEQIVVEDIEFEQ